MAFDSLSARDVPLTDAALAQVFTEARTRNGWTDRPVPTELLHKHQDDHRLAAADCLFIDDSAANVAGARAVGMAAHHFTTPEVLAADLVRRGLL